MTSSPCFSTNRTRRSRTSGRAAPVAMNSSSSACSAARAWERFRSLMSRAIDEMPMISPEALTIGASGRLGVDPRAVLVYAHGLERLDDFARA